MGSTQSQNQNYKTSYQNQSTTKQWCLLPVDSCGCFAQFICKKQKYQIIWKKNAIKNCEQLRNKYNWAQKIIQIIKTTNDERQQFMKQFSSLKYLDKKMKHEQILNFQSSIYKSLFLSYQQLYNNSSAQQSKFQSSNPSHIDDQNISHDIASCIQQTNLKKYHQSRKSKHINRQPQLRRSVASLVNDTMSSIFRGQQKQVQKLSSNSLQMFAKFTVMLQKHETNPDHPIYKIIQQFTQNIKQNFKSQKKIDSISNINKPRKLSGVQQITQLQLQKIITQIKKFIHFLNQFIFDYYSIGSLNQKQDQSYYLIKSTQNIKIINTAILLKDQQFYNFIFGIILQYNQQNQSVISQKYLQLHGKSPQYFQIKRQYCLNTVSVMNCFQQMPSIQKKNIPNFQPQNFFDKEQKPYIKCSQALSKITQVRTPIAKLKVIMQCSELITKTVVQFYQKNGLKLKNKMVDSDNVLSIFRYILSLNKIQNLFSHIFFIEMFATDQQKNMTMNGYYFTVLKCAIQKNFGEEEEQYQQNGEKEIQIKIQDAPKTKTKSKSKKKQQIQFSIINSKIDNKNGINHGSHQNYNLIE